MKIERTRYIIVRNNRTEIFCGASKNHSFEKIEELKNKKYQYKLMQLKR